MQRTFWLPLLLAAAGVCWVGSAAQAADEAVPRFDVSINGENFRVEGGHINRLESREHPGTTFRVAVQLARLQHCRLGNVQFDFQREFQLDFERSGNSATLKHPLGFAAIISDLGGPLPADQRKSTLTRLVDATRRVLESTTSEKCTVSPAQDQAVRDYKITGVTLSVAGEDQLTHSAIVYLVTGQKFTCSCLIQFRETDRDDVIDILDPTLESFRSSAEEDKPDNSDKPSKKPAAPVKPKTKSPAAKSDAKSPD